MVQWITQIILLLVHATMIEGNEICSRKYETLKTIRALGHADPGLKILMAHRGAHYPGCPENSRCAIDHAVTMGFEAVELDVRLDKDRTPWPAHDTRVGRTTSWWHGGGYFNAYTDDKYGPRNPTWHELTTSQLSVLHYRDSRGHVNPARLEPLRKLLIYIRENHHHLLVTLDVKEVSAIDMIVQMVFDLGMRNQIVLKFPSTYFRPELLLSRTRGLHFIPYMLGYYLDQVANDPRNHHLGLTPRERVLSYWLLYTKIPGFVAMEPPSIAFGNTPYGFTPVGPYAWVDMFFATIPGVGFGRFHWPKSVPQGYFDAEGHCCTPTASMPTSRVFGDAKVDNRGNLYALLQTANYVLSDNAWEMMEGAEKMGMRINICKLVL